MELHHGSTEIVSSPQYGLGRIANDYGRGFYCTEDAGLAMEWACKEGCRTAYVNTYHLDISGLNVLDLSGSRFHVLNWLSVLVQNRAVFSSFAGAQEALLYMKSEFLPDCTGADVMIGYRADDSYFSIARSFLQNAIPLSTLNAALRLGNLGKQVVLKSPAAFEALFFLGYGCVGYEEYFAKKCSRDRDARESFFRMKAKPVSVDDLFMMDIIRQRIKNDDARLF